MIKAMMTLYAATALHAGAGSATSIIDLPIQREVHTDFPVIAGSSLKGALRQEAEQRGMEAGRVQTVFGPEDSTYAGALLVGEARLLALPIRSLQSAFYWVTCPMILDRLVRDLRQLDPGVSFPGLSVSDEQTLLPSSDSNQRLVLEELDFGAQESAPLSGFLNDYVMPLISPGIGCHYTRKLGRDFAVVSDQDFQYLCKTGTQVSARIVLSDRKTSENLWYEETLPSETILWSFLLARAPRGGGLTQDAEVLDAVRELAADDSRPIQIGGNETVGQGWCYAHLYDGAGS